MSSYLRGRVIGIVGYKDSGKTTVVEELVGLLGMKGMTVGTVKHAHSDILLGSKAKDSARHLGAGARTAVVVGKGLVLVEKAEEEDLEDVAARYLPLCDVVVAEGFKHADVPKVAVLGGTDRILKETDNVIAVVGGVGSGDYPAFAPGETAKLVDFLLEKGILKPPGRGVTLLVNDKPVPMNEFVQASLAGVVTGFISALHDVDAPATIQVTMKSTGSDPV